MTKSPSSAGYEKISSISFALSIYVLYLSCPQRKMLQDIIWYIFHFFLKPIYIDVLKAEVNCMIILHQQKHGKAAILLSRFQKKMCPISNVGKLGKMHKKARIY